MFTDQDLAMAKALKEVMPETFHGLCTFHLMQNGIKHLRNIMKNGSNFLRDFKACMFQYEDESDFQIAWDKLLRDYNLKENKWLTNLYKIKEKLAKCYMKHAFTVGIRSTQEYDLFVVACIKHQNEVDFVSEYTVGMMYNDRVQSVVEYCRQHNFM